jgi:hypothetical protein
MRPKNKSAKRSEETKKKGKRLGKQSSLVRGESERHASPVNGRVEREMKRSKSNLEQTGRQRPTQCTAEQQELPASLTARPATVTRAQSVYKVKQGGESGRPSPDRTEAGRRPPPVSAPSSVIRSAAASVASTFPRSGPAQPAGEGATAANSTFPRRRPSEFDSRQVRGTQMLGREAWPEEEESGFMQVADLEVMEEAERVVKEEIVKERNLEGKEEQKEEEVEDIYQIPKPPVPVVVGKEKVQVIPYQKFF